MTNEQIEEVLPCPCCDKQPRITVHDVDQKPFMYFTRRYAVLCDWNEGGCGLEGRHEKVKVEAVEAWNTRTLPKQPSVDELAEFMEDNADLCFKIENGMVKMNTKVLATSILSKYPIGVPKSDLDEEKLIEIIWDNCMSKYLVSNQFSHNYDMIERVAQAICKAHKEGKLYAK